MRNGATLLELLVALSLLGALSGLAAPRLATYRDRAAVLELRERIVARIAETRSAALDRGGAALLVHPDAGTLAVVAGPDTLRAERLPYGPGAPEVVAPRAAIALVFDGLGIGRFASTTFRIRRGDAAAAVVVSSYGRVRRR